MLQGQRTGCIGPDSCEMIEQTSCISGKFSAVRISDQVEGEK